MKMVTKSLFHVKNAKIRNGRNGIRIRIGVNVKVRRMGRRGRV